MPDYTMWPGTLKYQQSLEDASGNSDSGIGTKKISVYDDAQTGVYNKYLQGNAFDPAAATNYFNQYYQPQFNDQLSNELAKIRGSYGTSGAFGSSMKMAEERATNQMDQVRAQTLADLMWKSQLQNLQYQREMLDQRPNENLAYYQDNAGDNAQKYNTVRNSSHSSSWNNAFSPTTQTPFNITSGEANTWYGPAYNNSRSSVFSDWPTLYEGQTSDWDIPADSYYGKTILG